MDINLELYKVFYYVATTLSFSEASRQLFISQSAVSQSVKMLEKKLNQALFVRSTKKVFLTPAGETLLQHVQPAIQMLSEGEELLTSQNNLMGQLRIGASDTICRYFLIDYLKRFHMDHPDVRIRITNSTSFGCADLLNSGQVDFIVSNWPNSRLNPHMTIKPICEFQDVFMVNQNFFSIEKELTLKELLDYPILMLAPQSTTNEYLQQIFAAQGLRLLPEVELNSNDLIMDLARIGLGIACIPDYMVHAALNAPASDNIQTKKRHPELTPVPLKNAIPKRQLIIVRNETLPLSQAAERFLEYF